MAETSWPFSTADVDENEWARMAPLWSADGITADSPAVTLGSGLTFNVPAGFSGWVRGFHYLNDGVLAKSASNNVNTSPRLDQLVLRLDRATHVITAQIKQGTPGSSPVLPSLTQDDTTWEIPVAYATCPGSASAQNYSGLVRNHLFAGDRAGTILRRGERSTTGGASASTADVGVLRVDGVPIVAGRAYRVVYKAHPGGPASAVSRTQIRYSTAASATTGSTLLPGSQAVQNVGSGPIFLGTPFVAGATGTLSVLLCHARDSGTGTASLSADGSHKTELWVEDAGVDFGNTGIVL